jgi:hypothetical protein
MSSKTEDEKDDAEAEDYEKRLQDTAPDLLPDQKDDWDKKKEKDEAEALEIL